MNVHPCHAEFISHQAGVLATCATETCKRVLGYIVAALHGNEFDRVGHVGDRDAYETFRDLFG